MIFVLLLAAVVLAAAIGIQKACFSREKFKKLSYSWELSLKKIAKGLIESDAEVVKNSYLNKTAEKIIERLTSHLERNPYKIEVSIVNDPMVNAFAFPGGLLVVYSGIIEKMASAEDFAALLAHELAHVIHRDSLKALVRQLGLGTLLAIVGSDSAGVAREVVRLLINNSFSREQEQRADNFAANLLMKAGIDPGHLASLLSSLKEGKKGVVDPKGVWKYLNTHPDIDSRIKAAQGKSRAFKGEERKIDADWQRARQSITLPCKE